jgi:ribulose kinase
MIAAVGVGLQPDLAAAQGAMARYGRTVEPDPARRALYDDLHGIYVDAIAAAATTARRLRRAAEIGARA